MTSIFGTIRKSFKIALNDDPSDVDVHHGYLTSFDNAPDNPLAYKSRTVSKRLSRKGWGNSSLEENKEIRRQTVFLDYNRNVVPGDKAMILPGINGQMFRTNKSLEKFFTNTKVQSDAQFKNYKVLKTLGKGTFATVRLAEHIPSGHKVAVKVINKSQLSPSDQEKIQREIKIMKCLNHPNIVKLYEVFEDSKCIYIVMEYVQRGEIYDYIVSKRRLTEEDARSKFRQVLSAVTYCHSRNIVHRDLKVENLLLDDSFNIKLCDFGFGNFFDKVTPLNTFCGSPPYAAPELFRGDKYTGPEVDVWSLGVILYTFLTGTLPFNGNSLPELKCVVLKGNFAVPNYVRVGSELFLRKFLKLDPKERITLQLALNEPWITGGYAEMPLQKQPSCEKQPNQAVIKKIMSLGYSERSILEAVERRKFDEVHGTYRIMCTFYEEESFFKSFDGSKDDSARLESTPGNPSSLPKSQSSKLNYQHQIEASPTRNPVPPTLPQHHYKKVNPIPPPRRRRQTTVVKGPVKASNVPANGVQAKLARRHSLVSQQNVSYYFLSNPAKVATQGQCVRINSFSEKIVPSNAREPRQIEEAQISKSSKVPPVNQHNLRHIFRRTKNIDFHPKQENGLFKRFPSMSSTSPEQTAGKGGPLLFKRSLPTKENDTTGLSNYSHIVSHHIGLDVAPDSPQVSNGIRKSSSRQSITRHSEESHPVQKNESLKEKITSLFRSIKRSS